MDEIIPEFKHFIEQPTFVNFGRKAGMDIN